MERLLVSCVLYAKGAGDVRKDSSVLVVAITCLKYGPLPSTRRAPTTNFGHVLPRAHVTVSSNRCHESVGPRMQVPQS
jgi:hypothetical protein